jgi:hypothetical protein
MFLAVGLALAIYGIGLGITVWMRVWFSRSPSTH